MCIYFVPGFNAWVPKVLVWRCTLHTHQCQVPTPPPRRCDWWFRKKMPTVQGWRCGLETHASQGRWHRGIETTRRGLITRRTCINSSASGTNMIWSQPRSWEWCLTKDRGSWLSPSFSYFSPFHYLPISNPSGGCGLAGESQYGNAIPRNLSLNAVFQ